ncbi:cobaltochelatase, CobN subunit [Gloeothece citriformis PCC 7424]|uniref:Cobaltochelatase, CobN subunit n=1 Tax=Gloeothece citriformis (strain PCC 7424) TaxID=65393 RepID=B7KI95_GLOC7|nr:cobaltochelatase subunit CobN [Gloeothece citriformis]ACK73582.1 cobaltochelatase, CobN subunit [Gloeothece citriformis PCC 7424]
MHRRTTTPGGWNATTEGVIFVEQTPASIIILTVADTEIQTIGTAVTHLPDEFPSLRVVNLLQLQQQLSIDHYAEQILSQAQVIIIRLLGGRSYWPYGLEVIEEIAQTKQTTIFILPGDDRPDPDLMTHSTVSLRDVNRLWRYLTEGGIENWVNALKFVADIGLGTAYNPAPPQLVPKVGLYDYPTSTHSNPSLQLGYKVGLLFYRAHYLSGNTLAIDALCHALIERNLEPVPLFVSSLRDGEIQETLLSWFAPPESEPIQILLNTTSFSIAQIDSIDREFKENLTPSELSFWEKLQVPVLQVIFSGGTLEEWETSFAGLTPTDVAMNVALPEVDGRIITRAVSFKSVKTWNPIIETDVVIYQPKKDRINFVADLALNWIGLKQTPKPERKIALILANYPNRDGRLGNGVGLDTPTSCIEILNALKKDGYRVENSPQSGDELIRRLTQGVTNDPEAKDLRNIYQQLDLKDYQNYFSTLPEKVQQEINRRWSEVGEETSQTIPIPGLQLGNIFIGIQPSRGYDRDPSLNYHAPDLEPTPDYLAYYYWLKEKFGAKAIVHIGKHGNLEWLPGKSLALANTCYPEIALGTLPHFYPFIVNDPGEGSQAKRRSHAVIIDHLTPPLTRAELYGDLEKLETLIDEYYEAQNLDPGRLKIIETHINKLIKETHLNQDLGIDQPDNTSITQFLTQADKYLCDLKEAQIRDGLHIFGQTPPRKQLINLIIAITRSPSYNRLGLIEAIAQDLQINLNSPPHKNLSLPSSVPLCLCEKLKQNRSEGDTLETLETYAYQLIETLINHNSIPDDHPKTTQQLNWIKTHLLPALENTPQEITHLLKGLDGGYIPPGASGAPTRGRPEVLPTGRNFYSVDIRAIPTPIAWDVGRKAAETLIERYTQDNGEYPQTLAISVWGTSTMRTGGDDVAQILALLGVQPIWDTASRRVVDYEILTPSALGRPRVDVTVRVSGFFRDSFPNILQLLYHVIKDVSSLKEEKEINPLAAQVDIEREFWENQGLTKDQAKQRSLYRIFGSKPGAYGAGLQGLIEAQNWQSDEDLGRAYINWSCYGYDHQGIGHGVPEVFQQRLKKLQVILHNQDNREHDLLDSDDYYQFQGGLTAAVRAITGKNPQTYFGDNSRPHDPKVRLLKEEIARVYRSRVVNPKWIEGVMRHGYKGAFEMGATVDYLFAYDATARCVEDFMYEGVAQAYLLDEKVQQFIEEKNPWVLRDMAERLLEAHQRGLWESASEELIEKLRAIVHHGEGVIEEIIDNG